LLLEPP
jgi:hypothetical protein